ncbi:hypothetical protein EYF80_029698 [Liparis tanakae]|uniref:Uncharacterized protein n=1 Tax=Liparis tanakae TaxID=230148 RepID=A0A4Z2H2X2_9TELE|nr:hypothetical protein EYF80_029698 [Liparis tanakae]
MGNTFRGCHSQMASSSSLAAAALTWSSDVPSLNTAIRGLVCSYSKASMDASGSESKKGKVLPHHASSTWPGC